MNKMEQKPYTSAGTCVAFGCFDGVHLGHRAVLSRLLRERELTPVAVTLEPRGMVLSTPEEKVFLMQQLGMEYVLSLPADGAGCPEDFVRRVLLEQLGAKKVVLGRGYTFGADDSGNAALLRSMGLEVEEVERVTLEGCPVTGQEIRGAFAAGEFSRAAALLGGGYLMMGPVVHGRANGRRHGMPTANLGFGPEKLLPPLGVYGGVARAAGQRVLGMTNVGRRPSADDLDQVTVETLLLDFAGDLYGEKLILELRTYIRPVMKFDDLDQVRQQIDRDILTARRRMGGTFSGERASGS